MAFEPKRPDAPAPQPGAGSAGSGPAPRVKAPTARTSGAKPPAAKPTGTKPVGTKPAATRRRTGSSAARGGSTAAASTRRSGGVLHRAVRANLTARALALVVVVLVLTISYATSLRIYFSQAHEIASTKAEIAESQASITDLQGQIARWNDPAYVAAQARERLGWLVPGETGYTVVGADGKPLGGGLTLDSSTTVGPEQPQSMWWDRMWGSVKAADKPAPVKANPANRAPVTPETKPR
ncbi:septum formation initiator family protein [Microlunatus spumicola]|uniref:Septum formation initiator family protein n=1 Tax=Microlunatus spumicola TaxID=81499 RepID=A0ABP6Y5G5_9ACTN